ncbi:hypothetical protein [Ornithinibacillus gellani]|nr:hypothetical protein [Ornithinibacillus gellani]
MKKWLVMFAIGILFLAACADGKIKVHGQVDEQLTADSMEAVWYKKVNI